MYLLESLWTQITTLCALFTIYPLHDSSQTPFLVPSRIAPTLNTGGGPIFQPPGVPDDSLFRCEYPAMVGWETCSTPLNRKCWLREKSTGKQFDINTNYEDEMPIGITRHYNIMLEDNWFAADGLNFTSAKLFKMDGGPDNHYPGPWIQACWGDTYATLSQFHANQ